MQKLAVFFLVLLFLCLNLPAEEPKAPPGMEVLKIGNVNYIVPKGTKVRKRNGITFLEGQAEYTARKFEGIEKQISGLKEENTGLKKRLKNLEETIETSQSEEE